MATSNLPPVVASKLIHINSKDRKNGSLGSFRVDLKTPIVISSLNHSIFLSLVSGIFPHTFHNVTSKNNTFRVTYEELSDGTLTDQDYTLPPGFYDTSSFKDGIQNILNNETELDGDTSFNFEVTELPLTKSFRLKFTSSVFRIYSLHYINNIYRFFGYSSNYDEYGNLIEILPFYDDPDIQNTSVSYVDMCYQSSPTNLAIVNELRVVVNNLQSNEVYNNTTESNKFILSNVLINSGPGEFIYYYPHYRNSVRVYDNVIQYLDISIENCFNEVVDFQNINFSLVIRVDFRKTDDREYSQKLNFLK